MISNDGNDFVADVDFDDPRVETAGAQLLAEPLARLVLLIARPAAGSSSGATGRVGGRRRSSSRSSAFCRAPSLRTSSSRSSRTMSTRELHEVAHHRLDVAADVADLGELRRLDLDERRLRQPRQPPRDLGLADAGRADHQDVLRRDLLGQLRRQLLAPHAVAQRDRHGALGRGLADDVLVELGDDLSRRQRVGGCLRSISGR